MKRPMLLCGCSYLLGIVIGYKKEIWLFLMIVLVLSFGILYIYKTYLRKWVFLLPFICFFGYFNMVNTIESEELNIDDKIDYKTECTFTGTVKDYTLEEDKTNAIIIVDKILINNNKYTQPITIKVTLDSVINIKLKDKIEGQGTLYELQPPRNDGGWNERLYYSIRQIDYRCYANEFNVINKSEKNLFQYIKEFKEETKENYYELLPAKEAGIVSAMILGDRDGLDEDIRDSFQKSGIMHILAISGMHITLLGLVLFEFLKKIGLSIRTSAIISIIILILYCYMTGASVSTSRAVIMVGIILGANIIGRTYDIISALSCAAIILLLLNPLYLLDVGFQLSFGTVMGITVITPLIEDFFPITNKLITLFAASVGAYLSVAPILAYYFYEVPIYAIIVNIIVIPLLSLVVPISIISGLLGFLNLFLAKICIGVVYFILLLYKEITSFVSNLPFNNIIIGRPSVIGILIFYVVIISLLYFKNHKKTQLSILISCIFILIISFSIKSDQLNITFLDVGQGDAIALRIPNKKTLLIDGGGSVYRNVGKSTIIPYLKYHGIRKIDYMFLTHSDTDHGLGLIQVLDTYKVGVLFMPETDYKNDLYKELINKAKEKDVRIITMSKGDVLETDDLSITCLHPTKKYNAKNNNAYSLVLSLEYKQIYALLTGDIEKNEENLLIPTLKNHDILKVPHHGSKSSSSDKFIDAINPQIAIVMSGKYNNFGHPHNEVIDRYNSYDTMIYNTADDGAIELITNGDTIRIKTKIPRDE
ncbi:MAG: DNA internalization-related competence protein ComEC/Rec2 [Eubacteriales bacterium]